MDGFYLHAFEIELSLLRNKTERYMKYVLDHCLVRLISKACSQ